MYPSQQLVRVMPPSKRSRQNKLETQGATPMPCSNVGTIKKNFIIFSMCIVRRKKGKESKELNSGACKAHEKRRHILMPSSFFRCSSSGQCFDDPAGHNVKPSSIQYYHWHLSSSISAWLTFFSPSAGLTPSHAA